MGGRKEVSYRKVTNGMTFRELGLEGVMQRGRVAAWMGHSGQASQKRWLLSRDLSDKEKTMENQGKEIAAIETAKTLRWEWT